MLPGFCPYNPLEKASTAMKKIKTMVFGGGEIHDWKGIQPELVEALSAAEVSFCQMLWMWGERILHDQAAFFSSPSTNTTPAMTWSRSR